MNISQRKMEGELGNEKAGLIGRNEEKGTAKPFLILHVEHFYSAFPSLTFSAHDSAVLLIELPYLP